MSKTFVIYLELIGWLVHLFKQWSLKTFWGQALVREEGQQIDQVPVFPVMCHLLISRWLCQLSLQICKCQVVNLGGKGNLKETDFIIKTYKCKLASAQECEIWPLEKNFKYSEGSWLFIYFLGVRQEALSLYAPVQMLPFNKNCKKFHN